jgi:dihydropteroate synthase
VSVERATTSWRAGPFDLACGGRTLVMGVLNVTPDSFSDGGRYLDTDAATRRGMAMVEEGADLIDVGGESTRPGAAPVGDEDEIRRVAPVIHGLVSALATALPISVDTRKGKVAKAALDAGASVVNDVSGGFDWELMDAVRASGAGMVLMHMRGTPATMQEFTAYSDVVADVRSELALRLSAAQEAGIPVERIAVDPGIGFAKTAGQNLELIQRIGEFAALGRPLLVGASRKAFIGKVLGGGVDDRLEGTLATVAWLVSRGVQIVRVHDVRAAVRVCRMVESIRDAEPGAEPEPPS